MKWTFIFFLICFLTAGALAESQSSVYYKALQAESNGDIAKSLILFERAASLPGPYTEEIRDILSEYNDALEESSPWSTSFNAKLAYYEMFYHDQMQGEVSNENGRDLQFTIEGSLDYNSENAIHSLSVSATTDYMLKNDMPSVDTTKWNVTPEIEYSLFLQNLLFTVGADFNIVEGDSLSIAAYNWTEFAFARSGNNKFGVAVWTYYRDDNYLSTTLYLMWRYRAQKKFASSLMVGGKFDCDSVYSYDATMYWSKWLGPTLRAKLAYNFESGFGIDLKWNGSYGFVVDWPYENSMQKFTSNLGLALTFKLSWWSIFAGADYKYKRYLNTPELYSATHIESSHMVQIKGGTKIEF